MGFLYFLPSIGVILGGIIGYQYNGVIGLILGLCVGLIAGYVVIVILFHAYFFILEKMDDKPN